MKNFLQVKISWIGLLLAAVFSPLYISAQQNQKWVFPAPAGFDRDVAYFTLNTPDGGFLLSSSTLDESNPFSAYQLPRLIKLDADQNTEWDNVYLPPTPPSGALILPTAILDAPDGGWMMSINDDTTGLHLLRLDEDGGQLWAKTLNPSWFYFRLLSVAPDHYLAVNFTSTIGNSFTLIKLGLDGEIISTVEVPLPFRMLGPDLYGAVEMANGDLLFSLYVPNTLPAKMRFARVSPDGTVLWESTPVQAGGIRIAPLPGDGFINIQGTQLKRHDGQGNLVDASPSPAVPNTAEINVAAYPDGSLLVSGYTVGNRGFLAKLAPDYSIVWSAEAPDDGQPAVTRLIGTPTSDGWAAGCGETVDGQMAFVRIQANTGIYINTLTGTVRKDGNDNCIADAGEASVQHARIHAFNANESFMTFSKNDGTYEIKLPAGDFELEAEPNEPFFYLCPDFSNNISFPAGADGSLVLDLPIQSDDLIHQISGTLRLDQNNNCTYDGGEPELPSWQLNVVGNGEDFSVWTDASGMYSLFVPEGSYTMTVKPINPNFDICSPPSQTIDFGAGPAQSAVADFVAHADVDCPLMYTSLTANNIRPCSTSVVHVRYRNGGTAIAENARVTVTLDPFLTFQGASISPLSINGQVLVFELGDVAPAGIVDWHDLSIQVGVDCGLQIGNFVCVSAAIEPDTTCFQAPQWNGAIVSVDGACDTDDNAVFKIRNIGNAPNSQLLDYVIVEDQIVLLQGQFQLNPGDSLVLTVPNNGQTLSCIADQEPGFPGDTLVTYSLTNCMGMLSGNPPAGGGSPGPFIDQACFDVSNSYDPNDKTASPIGIGDQHVIRPGSRLDYTIRFQNSGNDTAFIVVLRDTLSEDLDPGTLVLQGGSHPYSFALINGNILQFTFEGIMLPDSATNPAASQGYVQFGIRHRADLPPGTAIGNHAAIYFDYNPPVITETVWRTIDEFIILGAHNPGLNKEVPVEVYPNPLASSATILLPEGADFETYTFTLRDASGALVRTAEFQGKRYLFERNELPSGIYFWQIGAGTTSLAGGKLIVF
ncbi:MAG: T9SS type A sorting domain-containing protein [Lewinellaceae bacterium]|nr:T9SS type A sorting domain-containing protein [Lewinellaceae bacterium]